MIPFKNPQTVPELFARNLIMVVGGLAAVVALSAAVTGIVFAPMYVSVYLEYGTFWRDVPVPMYGWAATVVWVLSLVVVGKTAIEATEVGS